MANNNRFTFEISLSVLNHLGRNLYRSFVTVLGEAISNAWDADADNVWIYVDREEHCFIIKDDGIGMSDGDFQNKFLKIGYSKRRDGVVTSEKGRPFIGRKGIGKLALLSCADKITVITKIEHGNYVGGVIDNSGLDQAINDDLTPGEYSLGTWQETNFKRYTKHHDRGTIIHFENMKDGIRNTLDYLTKTVALYFRFSLLDSSFNIFINDEQITLDHLNELADKTEFAWKINDLEDPYVDEKLTNLKEEISLLDVNYAITGFIASVEKPSHLKILTTDEKVGVDLFVNGRLRERDILKHIPSARLVESYLYGQVHFDELDDNTDRFTSSRESIVSNDPKFREFLETFRQNVMRIVLDQWDVLRRKHKKDGDVDNESISKKRRKSEELYNAVSEEYEFPEGSESKARVDVWVDDLSEDAAFNFVSYAECFLSENLIRSYIHEQSIDLSHKAQSQIQMWKERESNNKMSGNVNIDIRQNDDDTSYLDMPGLANLVDKQRGSHNCLPSDAKQYKPIRDALMHTARLTTEAKKKLTAVYDNIKARIEALLSKDESEH